MITPAETGTCHLEDGEVITIPGGSQGQKLRLTMWKMALWDCWDFRFISFRPKCPQIT